MSSVLLQLSACESLADQLWEWNHLLPNTGHVFHRVALVGSWWDGLSHVVISVDSSCWGQTRASWRTRCRWCTQTWLGTWTNNSLGVIGFEILRVTTKETVISHILIFHAVQSQTASHFFLALNMERVVHDCLFWLMSLSLLFFTPVFLSVTVLVCPSRWPTGWTTAAQGPYRQNWLWHSRHWRSAVHYSVCFFHLLPFSFMLYFFLSPSCSHSYICYSAFPSSLIVTLVQSKSFLCTQCFSLLSFTTDNSWLSHLLNVFLVAAKMLYI